MDLLAASPATVSRCGMIYLEPSSIGHGILLNSWHSHNTWIPVEIKKALNENFALIDEIYYLVKSLKTICFTSSFSLIQSFLKILDVELHKIQSFINNFPEEFGTIEEKYKVSLVNGIFIFAVMWSFGVSVDTASKKTFDLGFKRIIVGDVTQGKKKKNLSFPEKMTFFDYLFKINEEKLSYEWVKWTDLIEDNYPKDTKIHEIIVRTS
jgi:dynein heavy chain, axonemal